MPATIRARLRRLASVSRGRQCDRPRGRSDRLVQTHAFGHHRCSIAGAQAAAFFPTQSTLPNPAVAITASGTAGANLNVSFDNFTVSAPVRMPLLGTGSTKRYVACLPAGAARKAALALTVGESGTCAEPLEDTFEVRSLEVISENQCAP
jgi:hypothetical protein